MSRHYPLIHADLRQFFHVDWRRLADSKPFERTLRCKAQYLTNARSRRSALTPLTTSSRYLHPLQVRRVLREGGCTAELVCFAQSANYAGMALPFLTGCHFSNTKDVTVTKGKPTKSRLFSPFVYFVSFVVRLFPVKYGRPAGILGY
jgi:hypothetical protein